MSLDRNPKKAPDLDSKGIWKVYMYAGSMGLGYCFEVLAGGLLGYFLGQELDNYMGYKSLGKVSLVVLFMGVAIVHVVIGLQSLQDKMDKMMAKYEKSADMDQGPS